MEAPGLSTCPTLGSLRPGNCMDLQVPSLNELTGAEPQSQPKCGQRSNTFFLTRHCIYLLPYKSTDLYARSAAQSINDRPALYLLKFYLRSFNFLCFLYTSILFSSSPPSPSSPMFVFSADDSIFASRVWCQPSTQQPDLRMSYGSMPSP